MRFGLLGELEIEGADGPIEIPAPKQRALLALLLLNRGKPVGVDRLAADLWGDAPPPSAIKTVQVYVAQLRKLLGEGVLLTRGRAYFVDLGVHDLDLARFEQRANEGRLLLENGEAQQAAEVLREALAYWRGPALADFTYEEFAQAEIARLDEERLSVIEARVEADLALGAADELVLELQGLVRSHQLRERLSGQLMLALYRSGRQAEALAEYQRVRRTLRDEVGLEPGPALQELERAILAQDESLGSTPVVRRLPAATRRRGALLAVAGGGLLLAATIAAAVVALTRGGGGGIALPVQPSSVAAVDLGSGRVVGEFPVGASPAAVSVDSSGVWVFSADDKTVSRVDPRSKEVRTIGVGAFPTDVVAGLGSVWIGTGSRFDRATFAGWVATSVLRMNARTGGVEATVPLPQRGGFVSNKAAQHLALARGRLWAIAPDSSIVSVDPRSNAVVKTIQTRFVPVAIASDGSVIWVLNDDGSVSRIGANDRVTARIRVPAEDLSALAVSGGAVWATSPQAGTLWRIEPGLRSTQRTIDVGVGADSVAFGAGYVWVANSIDGTLRRVDPATNKVDRTVAIGNTPTGVAVGADAVWVTVAGGAGAVAATHGRRGDVTSLPGTFCGPLVSGSKPPALLIASDLPLQGGPRFPTAQMSEAIQFVLRRHNFRAGFHSLAYQSCDDSTAQTGLFDPAKCVTNAKAYGQNKSVIGVVGPYNSPCAYAQLPTANRWGLPMVSPTNSDVGLTRAGFGVSRSETNSLYPTGTRTFARVIPTDDAQGAAAASLLRRLGARRVYVLRDTIVGPTYAYYFRRAAVRLGLDVVGDQEWDPKRPAGAELASRVARAHVDAVYLCGLIDTGVGEILAAVRHVLGPRKALVGCSGLLPSALLFERAGSTARGTYVTLEGLAVESLGPVGRAFLHDFAATQAGKPITSAAVYAAEATEVLVQAIARSDGTRAGVARELLKTRVRDGLLGDFTIDAHGDVVPMRTTIVQVERNGGSNAVQNYSGARIVGVIESSLQRPGF